MTGPINTYRSSIVCGVLAAALAANAAGPKTTGIELRGHIVGDGGKPVAHASVRVLPAAATASQFKAVAVDSGEDGTFVAGGLTGSLFRIRVDAHGYAPITEAPIPAGATLHLRLKRGFALTGVVLERRSRKPVAAAKLFAWEAGAEAWGEASYRTAVSGKDGRFTLPDLPAGKMTVETKAPGHAIARTPNLAVPTPRAAGNQPPAEFAILLDPAGSLTGRVTDTSAAAVVGAEIAASWRDAAGAEKSKKAKSDSEGHYVIMAGAEVIVSRMIVRAAGFTTAERDGPGSSDGVTDFLLLRGGIIAGHVTTVDGKAPASFRVRARPDRESAGAKTDGEFTDPSGAFRLENVQPGTYTIEVAAEHWATWSKASIDVRAEQVAELGTLTLESNSTLRGRVLSARDDAPVAGATVRVSLVSGTAATIAPGGETLWTATSSPDGSFSVRGLGEGTFDVAVEQPAFSPARTRISFDPTADAPELLLRMYRGGMLTGTVTDANNEPAAGVRIVASQGPDADARVADTGTDGRYFIDGLTPGTYQVMRQPAGQTVTRGATSKAATIQEGETTTVDFDEMPHLVLSGTVRKGDAPLVNAPIYFFALDGRVPANVKKTMTDSQGSYSVGLDQGGRYQASVKMGDATAPMGQNVVMLTIPDEREVHQDIVFAANAIVGKVTDPEGAAVRGAVVLAVQDGASHGETPRQASTSSRPDGTFRLDGVDPGTYRVSVRAHGFAPGEAYPVAVIEGQPEPEVDLKLEHGWLMRGRVLDAGGGAVPDATVVVAPTGAAESGFLPTRTDRTGAFQITSSAEGPINVAAISPRLAPAVQTDVQPPESDDPPELVLHATLGGSLRIRVVHRGGGPVAGIQAAFRPVPLFPGSDLVMDRNRPKLTDADGISVVPLLYPGDYIVSLNGRRDVAPMQVAVGEGTETAVQFEVP